MTKDSSIHSSVITSLGTICPVHFLDVEMAVALDFLAANVTRLPDHSETNSAMEEMALLIYTSAYTSVSD